MRERFASSRSEDPQPQRKSQQRVIRLVMLVGLILVLLGFALSVLDRVI